MQLSKPLCSLALTAALFVLPPIAHSADTAVCSLDSALLVCADNSKNAGKILEAMSNPATLNMLTEAGSAGLIYSDSDQREAFRKSLEANRVAMKRYADKAWKQYRRRKMKAEAYEAVRAKYNAGMKSYQAGMSLYRAGTWNSTTKGRQAD